MTFHGGFFGVHRAFVGEFLWSAARSGALLDFERVVFNADGTYTAKVEATLVNAGVRCTRFPFTLPEEGRWTAFKVAGVTKLRVRPSTGPSRVYVVPTPDGEHTITLARRGVSTKLLREGRTLLGTASLREDLPSDAGRSDLGDGQTTCQANP